MLTKIIYVIIDSVAIVDIIIIINAMYGVGAAYGKWLKRTLVAAIVAISSNILIASSFNAFTAEIAYCAYFASIDWILYFLAGFCLLYTGHDKALRKVSIPVAVLMATDSLLIFINPLFKWHFTIYENTATPGVVFYQTAFNYLYYVHLAIDYTVLVMALLFLILKIIKSYDMYRMKYLIILSVLLLVIFMNLAYMTLSLVLDASVIFYAVAGTLIYFCTEIFVPRRLMNTSVGRAVDDMIEGLILFDISNNCIYANAFARSRFGVNIKTFDLSCEPAASVLASLKEEGRQFGETSYEKTSGSVIEHYSVRYTSLLDKRGRSIGSYFLIQDRTEEVFYLHEIEDARINADNANQAKSTFLANMSHEIRTPLNSVLGMNEMILRSTDDPLIREYAGSIKTSGETLLSLINDILDFSKIEAGHMETVETDYDPHHLLNDCYQFFEQPASAKDLYLHINCDKSIPRRLTGDMTHIRQILTNILSNAIKYTKEGGVTLKISTRNIGTNRTELVAEISDTGAGIDEADIPYLFDAFKRINEKENAAIQGTGLGLAITHELVTMLHGSIYVDSTPGVGSTFTIMLPQGIADPAPAGELVLSKTYDEPSYKESFRAPDARILIVDDVPLNLKVVCALLRKTLVNIDTATSGDEAISVCAYRKYDVILLDHRMPKKDGIETFREISEKGLNYKTPVVMLTANALNGVEEEYRKLGFSGYLSKPIDVHALEEILIKLLPKEKVELTAIL